MSAKRPADDLDLPASKTAKTVSTTPKGVVDAMSEINGGEVVVIDDDPCDAMLVKITPSIKVDNFYVLQLIKCTDGHGQNGSQYVVYKRYGRTGTEVSKQPHSLFTTTD